MMFLGNGPAGRVDASAPSAAEPGGEKAAPTVAAAPNLKKSRRLKCRITLDINGCSEAHGETAPFVIIHTPHQAKCGKNDPEFANRGFEPRLELNAPREDPHWI